MLAQEPVCIGARDRLTRGRAGARGPRGPRKELLFISPNQPCFTPCLGFSSVRFGPYCPSMCTCDC